MVVSKGVFKTDLMVGKKFEEIICGIIQKKYPKTYVIKGYEKRFDIYIPEIEKFVEVKYDEMSHETGNYLIETEYGGNPSGLTVTRADWWAIVDREVIVWVPTESLKFMVRAYKEVSLRGRGDSKFKKGFLIPKGNLQESPLVKVQSLDNEKI